MPGAQLLWPTHHVLFNDLSVGGSLHCFDNLVIVSNAAMSIRVQPGLLYTFAFYSDEYSQMGLLNKKRGILFSVVFKKLLTDFLCNCVNLHFH